MKKILSFTSFSALIIILFALFSFSSLKKKFNQTPSKHYVVAITQIAQHPSLDEIRRGIESVLCSKEHQIEIVFQNAQGNMTTSMQIAHAFVALKPDLAIAITTPSTLSLYPMTKAHQIPLIYSGVSDPVSAKLMTEQGESMPFLTGIYDKIPANEQVKAIQLVFKEIPSRVGVLYNPGEANSTGSLEAFVAYLKEHHPSVTVTPVAVDQMKDISQKTLKLCDAVDLIYIFNDNLVVSAMTQILKITSKRNVPVMASDPESVALGCVASLAYDQFQIGVQTGKIALDLLANKDRPTHHHHPQRADGLTLYINQHHLLKYGLSVSTPTAQTLSFKMMITQ